MGVQDLIDSVCKLSIDVERRRSCAGSGMCCQRAWSKSVKCGVNLAVTRKYEIICHFIDLLMNLIGDVPRIDLTSTLVLLEILFCKPHPITCFVAWSGTPVSVCEFFHTSCCHFQVLMGLLPDLLTPVKPFISCRSLGWTCVPGTEYV